MSMKTSYLLLLIQNAKKKKSKNLKLKWAFPEKKVVPPVEVQPPWIFSQFYQHPLEIHVLSSFSVKAQYSKFVKIWWIQEL